MAHVHEEVGVERKRTVDVIGVALAGMNPEGLAGGSRRSADIRVLLIAHTGGPEAIGTRECRLR
jgi:hypothetical protein